jgi:hypothetical protein
VVKTGARAGKLEALLIDAGLHRSTEEPPRARVENLPIDFKAHIDALYMDLDGQVEAPSFRPGKWDLAFEGGLVVELDEELHFNRYRALTLSGNWTQRLPWTTDYLSYCDHHEPNCLADGRWGKRWTNPSCERLFGPADAPGSFGAGGAPRWKQRALYDAIKDAFALAGVGVRLARLAVYDRCEGVELGAILAGHERVSPNALASLVKERTTPT